MEKRHNPYYYCDNSYMITIKNTNYNSIIEYYTKSSNSKTALKLLKYHLTNNKIINYSLKELDKSQNIELKLNKSNTVMASNITLNFLNDSNTIRIKYEVLPNFESAIFTIFFINKGLITNIIHKILAKNEIPYTLNEFNWILINLKDIIYKYSKINLKDTLNITEIIANLNNITKLNLDITSEEQAIINNSIQELPLILNRRLNN